jgi:hypothetical protein
MHNILTNVTAPQFDAVEFVVGFVAGFVAERDEAFPEDSLLSIQVVVDMAQAV